MKNGDTPRILYNAASARVGGGLSYAVNQINALLRVGEVDLYVLTAPWNHAAISSRCPDLGPSSRLTTPVRRSSTRFLWEQSSLPFLARRFDVLVCPGNFAPLIKWAPTVTILQNPNYVGDGRRAPQNRSLSRRLKVLASHLGMMRSDHVVVISKSLANEFEKERRLRWLPHSVITSGAADSSPPARGRSRSFMDRLQTSFALSVANDYEHKHLLSIVAGWRRYREQSGDSLALVMVGYLRPGSQGQLERAAGPYLPDLHLLHSLEDPNAVKLLYRRAAVTVAASSLEAFPLTPHEAGAQGSPLALSDIPPHREVAGEHATFFPVGDIESLAEAIAKAVATERPQPWTWSWTWDDHARALSEVLWSTLRTAEPAC